MGSVLDVIFVTLSQNFQRATMKPVMGGDGVEVWVKREEGVGVALEHVRESLKTLVVGFDVEIDSFIGRLNDEVRYKPPEQRTIHRLFRQFAGWLSRECVVVSVPVVRKEVGDGE